MSPVPQSFVTRLDALHLAVLDQIPASLFDADIASARALMEQMTALMPVPTDPAVSVQDHYIRGPDAGQADLLLRIYRHKDAPSAAPVLYHIHGGGMVLGKVTGSDGQCIEFATAARCVVASIEYRLAPETKHPGPIEDCYTGLKWLRDHADSLGIDTSRIAVGGVSAGGGLAASLVLLARDRGDIDIAYQWLICPMLDDRNSTPSAKYVTHPKVWNHETNAFGWRSLLGDDVGSDRVSPYAAAARAGELGGLPPAFIIVSGLDLFLDECLAYAQRLMQAGNDTEFHVIPGGFHGSHMMVPQSEISQRYQALLLDALDRALNG